MQDPSQPLVFALMASQFALYAAAWAAYSALSEDNRGPARNLGLFNTLVAVGMALAWTRDETRGWLAYVGSSLCFVAAFFAAWHAMAGFARGERRRKLKAAVFWAIALVVVYAGPSVEGAPLRVFATFFGCAIVTTLATLHVGPLLRQEFKWKSSRHIRAACVVAALLMGWRAVSQLMAPDQKLELNDAAHGLNSGLVLGLLLAAAAFNFSCLGLLLLRYIRQLHRLTHHDPLTDLLNRRAFEEASGHEWARRKRDRTSLAVAAFDLDHFKSVNDTHGHAAGDAVLVHTARLLRQMCREVDLVARLGGEEFVVVMPETTQADALAAAERMRAALAAGPVALPDGKQLRVTSSIGLAMAEAGDADVHDTLKRADEALYKAKKSGRNRVEQAWLPELPRPAFQPSTA